MSGKMTPAPLMDRSLNYCEPVSGTGVFLDSLVSFVCFVSSGSTRFLKMAKRLMAHGALSVYFSTA